jgi:hypothetical protein
MKADASKLLVFASLALLVLTCGCAEVGLEAIGAGAAEGAMAPELTEAATEAAAEGGTLTEILGTDRIPTRGWFIEDGETPGLYINGNHLYDIDMTAGKITDTRGNLVAQIEGNEIYRVYPRGAHQLIAKVETYLAEPTAIYNWEPTDLTRIRMLKTNDLVQVVEANDGWYKLKYLNENGVEMLVWAFAPALLTHVERKDQNQSQPVSFETRPSKRTVMLSALESAKQVKSDIDTIVSGQ